MPATILSSEDAAFDRDVAKAYAFVLALHSPEERTYRCTTCGITIDLDRARKVKALREAGKIEEPDFGADETCEECETPHL